MRNAGGDGSALLRAVASLLVLYRCALYQPMLPRRV